MHDRVGECLGEGQFDIVFLAGNAVRLAYFGHDLLHDGVHGVTLRGQSHVQLQREVLAVAISILAYRRFLSHEPSKQP